MEYKAYLEQNCDGCDYTIGCGRVIIDIEADNIDDATKKLKEIILKDYRGDNSLQYVEIYEVNKTVVLPIFDYYIENAKIEEEKKKLYTEELEKIQYQRLKAKYG